MANPLGRPKVNLSHEDKIFIVENREKMSYVDIADALGLGSAWKVQQFCKHNAINKNAGILTEEQKQYIRDNYKRFKESDICRAQGITRFQLQKFKRTENLVMQDSRKIKRASSSIVKTGYFDCSFQSYAY